MKKALSVFLQTLLLLAVFFVGFFVQPFNLVHVLVSTPDMTRTFSWDGLVLMLLVYALLLAIQALRKRLRTSAPWTTVALFLATAIGLAMKLGFITHEG